MSFIMENCRRLGYPQEFTYVDTVGISRVLLKNQSKHTLDAVAKTLGISLENHHRAVDDAECTAHIFVKFIKMLEEQDIHNLTEVNALGASSVDAVKKMPLTMPLFWRKMIWGVSTCIVWCPSRI